MMCYLESKRFATDNYSAKAIVSKIKIPMRCASRTEGLRELVVNEAHIPTKLAYDYVNKHEDLFLYLFIYFYRNHWYYFKLD